MVPGGLCEVADRVDHHQRPLPARGAKSPSDPAVFVMPVRKLAAEPRLDLVWLISALFRILGHRRSSDRQMREKPYLSQQRLDRSSSRKFAHFTSGQPPWSSGRKAASG